jgi:hypothetical protein
MAPEVSTLYVIDHIYGARAGRVRPLTREAVGKHSSLEPVRTSPRTQSRTGVIGRAE